MGSTHSQPSPVVHENVIPGKKEKNKKKNNRRPISTTTTLNNSIPFYKIIISRTLKRSSPVVYERHRHYGNALADGFHATLCVGNS